MSRLVYKELEESYASELLPIWGDKEVIRYTSVMKPYNLEKIIDRIKLHKKNDEFVVFKNDEVIGVIGCPCIDKEKHEYGVFYQFCKSSWGQGYATECVEWLLTYMKNKYKTVTLYADVRVENIASEKLLVKNNFQLDSSSEYVKENEVTFIHTYVLHIEED